MKEKKGKKQNVRQDSQKAPEEGNPRQNDNPSHDENNDQNRTNKFGQEYAS